MSSPPGPGIDRASVRGIIVLVVAVAIGAALLSRTGGESLEAAGTRDQGDQATEETTGGADTGPSSVPQDTLVDPTEQTSTTLGEPRPPGEVSVLVVNSSDGVPGAAGDNVDAASAAGYQTLPPQDGPSADTTTVYFTDGYQADAAAIAEALGFPDAPVAPQLEPIIPEAAEANVTVQLGQDIAPG